jgi:pimeloyl-ACP methyl ester carboxylesterase
MLTVHEWDKQSLMVRYHNHKISYHNVGESTEAILILHGFWQSSWHWQHIINALSKQYRVIVFDYIGAGLSEKPANYDYNIDTQADIAEDILRLLTIEKVHIVAHDIGGVVAQDLLKRQVIRRKAGRTSGVNIASINFLNGPVGLNDFKWTGGYKLILSRILRNKWLNNLYTPDDFKNSIANHWGNGTPPTAQLLDGTVELMNAKNGYYSLFKIIDLFLDKDYHQIGRNRVLKGSEVPHQLIAGNTNIYYPRANSVYERYFAHAKTTILDGIGYHPHLEAPEAVVQHIQSFLAGV